ncbi:hypothetical protein CS542_06305 [Pedobacter sp. IW39]|nr:hypothetical protein CS542_06305 [Pedobacter sp. IW39]
MNLPPFTWDDRLDVISGTTGGILARCAQTNTCPLIIQTLSSRILAVQSIFDEYRVRWNKRFAYSENVRIYLINGTEHSPMDLLIR